MARSLLTIGWIHDERPPVFSVTPDAAANLSFQVAPPRPTRPDPSQGDDSFWALVDSSTPVDSGNDRPTAAEPAASQRRADDTAATADNRTSRDAPASDTA